MATNLYHVLSFMPAIERWEMPPALEKLAARIVASGKLRINADFHRNFVRYDTMTFTTRELMDKTLSAATRERMARYVAPASDADGVKNLWQQLRKELKKARGIDAIKEMRVARVLVQSAHPAVIELLIRSGTEIFVSYSHDVSDLMQMEDWKTHGLASGLQATEDSGTAVYVSAGGDPFFEGEHKTYVTDGFPALARMVVIAGQELGHFADLRRSAHGIIGRHSTDANASQLRADPTAREAWIGDRGMVGKIAQAYRSCGLGFLRKAEKGLAFYHTRLRYSPPWMFYQLWRFIAWSLFIIKTTRKKLCNKFRLLPYIRLGESIEAYLADMAYNLAPDADAYRNPDPLIEEAILVLEAVARVPQQIHKWGFSAVFQGWPRLTKFYFGTIIPACEKAIPQSPEPISIALFQRLIINIKRGLRARPDYYP